MTTKQIFQISNNIRLLRIASVNTKLFKQKPLRINLVKNIDLHDKQFEKTILETTTIYGN